MYVHVTVLLVLIQPQRVMIRLDCGLGGLDYFRPRSCHSLDQASLNERMLVLSPLY